jgi:hypothetical protein
MVCFLDFQEIAPPAIYAKYITTGRFGIIRQGVSIYIYHYTLQVQQGIFSPIGISPIL